MVLGLSDISDKKKKKKLRQKIQKWCPIKVMITQVSKTRQKQNTQEGTFLGATNQEPFRYLWKWQAPYYNCAAEALWSDLSTGGPVNQNVSAESEKCPPCPSMFHAEGMQKEGKGKNLSLKIDLNPLSVNYQLVT